MLVHRPARVGSARPCATNSTCTLSPRPLIDILAVVLACAALATAAHLPAQTPPAALDNASENKLPDAPNSTQPAPSPALLQPSPSTPTASVPLRDCPYDQTHARECRVHRKQWTLGPIGEAGVGHMGDHLAADNGRISNETGFVSLVTTPVGGTHEFGAWWGLSLFSGSLVGTTKDVKYMPIDVRYSYRFVQHPHWALRYAPEITALAMLDWPTPWGAAPFNLRQRAYGSGLSPEGFQLDLLPCHRVQPFFSQDGGFIYFADRVLSPQGSRFMYTVDLGVGVNIFRRGRQAVTIGYRYQHLSNANISDHNPGTDANTFYVGVSRFRDRHPPAR